VPGPSRSPGPARAGAERGWGGGGGADEEDCVGQDWEAGGRLCLQACRIAFAEMEGGRKEGGAAGPPSDQGAAGERRGGGAGEVQFEVDGSWWLAEGEAKRS